MLKLCRTAKSNSVFSMRFESRRLRSFRQCLISLTNGSTSTAPFSLTPVIDAFVSSAQVIVTDSVYETAVRAAAFLAHNPKNGYDWRFYWRRFRIRRRLTA